VVLSTHAAGNLCNSYFDFKNGVDKDTADDRTLVDRTVPADHVLYVFSALFALAGLLFGYLAWFNASHYYAFVAAPAILLALAYTANPFNLKRIGLGDVVIFACFGPLLMLSVYMTLAGPAMNAQGCLTVLALSLPVGLLTDAILHANNTRDVEADRAAGVFTVAQALGPEGCEKFYLSLLGGGYSVALALIPVFSWRCGLVLCAAPWATYIVRLFQAGILEELPQRTAQHNLLFVVLLTGSIVPPMFFARFLLACLFYLGGIQNLIMWNYTTQLVHERLSHIVKVSLGVSNAALGVAAAAQLVASVFFILGYHTRFCAQFLLVWLVPVTFVMHDLWTIEGEEYGSGGGGSAHFSKVIKRTVPTFPTEFDNEFVHFFKNVGMIGGLAIYLEMGGGLPGGVI